MKAQLISVAIVAIISTTFANNVKAQEGLKKLPDVTVTSTTNVSKKVADYFKTHFSNAENPKWTRLNKDFLVEFITADINNRVLFHKNGAIVYHLKYGNEKNLPAEVRRLVKSAYYLDYNITKAINVLQDRRDIWIVNIEDGKKYVIVRVEDGELEEVSSLTKSS